MKLSSISLAAILSLASAQPLGHEHHIHKREAEAVPDLVTVVVTQYVTAQAQSSSSSAESLETTSTLSAINALAVEPESLSSSAYDSVSSKSSTSASYFASSFGSSSASASSFASSSTSAPASSFTSSSASSSYEGSSTASSSKASSSSTATGASAQAANGAKGITYSPYQDDGSCKDASTIQSDIKLLSQFDVIRLYDTDCSGVENVLAAKTSSQQLFAGIYYLAKIDASVEIISSAISNGYSWDDIYTVSVGNELVNSGEATTSQIKSAIDSTRSALTSAGYSGKVVSVDTLVAVQDNTALCDYSDYIAVNSHPYWDGSVEAANSGTWLKEQIANIKSTCGGEKSVLITETGWPTQGDTYGSAVPSTENQVAAIKSIVEEVGDQVILFTTYNDFWKSAGSYGVEQYWGIFD